MGIMSTEANLELQRILCYGPPKARKTWWALRAAELGYNVILADFDHGAQIAKQLPADALERIYRIDMRQPEDGTSNNAAFAAMTLALNNQQVLFDTKKRLRVIPKRLEDDATYDVLNLYKSTPNDVLIVDSWTALCVQISEFLANSPDPLRLPEYNLEQSEYNKMRMLADRALLGLQKLPCHVVVIGHSIEYAKRKADAAAKDKPESAIEWVRTTIGSVTKAHGMTLPAAMSDVLYFEVENSMQGVYISTKASEAATTGSRSLSPMKKKWEELGVELLLPKLPEISATFSSDAVRTATGTALKAETEAKASTTASASLNASVTKTLKIGK